jgi:hypothetical protein
MMKQFDHVAHIKSEIESNRGTFLRAFAGDVGKEVGKINISHEFETKEHKFGDGEVGEIAKKLTIVIDFGDAIVQPHQDFENDFCVAVSEVLGNEVNGLFENYDG